MSTDPTPTRKASDRKTGTGENLRSGPGQNYWFLREIEKSGREMVTPASHKVTLIALLVMMATISSGMGGITLLMAQNILPGVALMLVAFALIYLIWYGLTKKTAPPPR